jgi:hypothetical protein
MLSRQEEQLERRDVLENEKRLRGSSSGASAHQGSTFLQHTHNDVGGRFAAISSPTVVGEKAIPQYPAAFHQHDPVPDEPPLGLDVMQSNLAGSRMNSRDPCPSMPPLSRLYLSRPRQLALRQENPARRLTFLVRQSSLLCLTQRTASQPPHLLQA